MALAMGCTSDLELEVRGGQPRFPRIQLLSATLTADPAARAAVLDCDGASQVALAAAAPSGGDPAWKPCALRAPLTATLPADGAHALRAWGLSTAGELSASPPFLITLDRLPPQLALTTFGAGQAYRPASAQPIGWTLSDPNLPADPVTVEYSPDSGGTWILIAAGLPAQGPYAWLTPPAETSSLRVRVRARDRLGHEAVAASSADVSLDGTPPTLDPGQLVVSPVTSSPFPQLAARARDGQTRVRGLCVRVDSADPPAAEDPCWVEAGSSDLPAAPAAVLSVSNHPFLLSLAGGAHVARVWVRDDAGNISTHTASLGTDQASVTLAFPSPPTIDRIVAGNAQPASSAPTPSERAVPAGSTVYVSWSASDDLPLPGNAVSLAYSLDGVTFLPVPGAQGIANGANGACSLSGGFTGCFAWPSGSPVSSGYRVRALVEDAGSAASSSETAVLNPGRTAILAGSPALGHEGAASSAALAADARSTLAEPGSLVVSRGGVAYLRDSGGILRVDPQSSRVSRWIPATGVSSGDGGPIALASLSVPHKIALDAQDRLLILDRDRIRRADPVADVIETIVTVSPPGSAAASSAALVPLPDGDLLFQSDAYGGSPAQGARLRRLSAATGAVADLSPSGGGIAQCPVRDFSVAFHPTTGQLLEALVTTLDPQAGGPCSSGPGTRASPRRLDPSTFAARTPPPLPFVSPFAEETAFTAAARDGGLYRFSRLHARLARYVPQAGAWLPLLGTGSRGSCSDGTAAASCGVDLRDVFIARRGQIFFLDGGGVRYVDPERRVRTWFGTSGEEGDGGDAASARFRRLSAVEVSAAGELVALDSGSLRLRAVAPSGAVSTLAGNGANRFPGTQQPASDQPLEVEATRDTFALDPVTGDILYSRGLRVARLARATGTWEDVAGGGPAPYPAADGLAGAAVGFQLTPQILGWDGTRVLSFAQRFQGTGWIDAMLKLHAAAGGVQEALTGQLGATQAPCPDGSPAAGCGLSADDFARAQWDAARGRWLLLVPGQNRLRALVPGGTASTAATFSRPAAAFAFRSDSVERTYFCATDGTLWERTPSGTETPLPFDPPSLRCTGRSLVHDVARARLVFPAEANGQAVIGGYDVP